MQKMNFKIKNNFYLYFATSIVWLITVLIKIKYNGLISFANSERIKYKQEWREGEKVGKVSLLKDIDTQQPHRGHLSILTVRYSRKI